jgi:hypothetical protein
MDFHCDVCGIASLKTKQAYQRHLLSKKHLLRIDNTRDLRQCKQCNKWFCGQSGMSHHKMSCGNKIIDQTITIQEILLQQIDEMKQAFEIERQEMKVRMDNLEKNAGTINNTNIETQNIHININAFGNENTDYIDDTTIITCIDRVYKSIPSLLEKIHFDPKHPENHNIKITNKKLPYASVMGDNQKWKTVDRKDAIESMVINGYNMLDEKYIEKKEKILLTKQKNFEGFQNKFETENKELMKQIKNDVDMMILNSS